MPPVTSQHPTEQTLIAYGLGKIDDGAAGAVMRHLEGCEACKGRVAELSADSFVGKLRANRAGGSVPGVPAAARAMPQQDASAVPAELLALSQYSGVKELGRGGMGVVYLARNVKMDRLEVLKVVQRSSLERAGAGAVERFLREIQAAARLQHPNVVAAYAVLEPGDLLVFAMEYAAGHDLAKVVKLSGALPVPVACSYAHSAAMGLQHAHEAGMVHRDIKPGNLILTRVHGKPAVKVLDFGLAKVTTGDRVSGELTGDGKMMGTPDFMAPEQAMDASRADIRADIYSLGCTLYYLLAGRTPFGGGTLMQVIDKHRYTEATPLNLVQPAVPVELAAAVAKMMAKDPARRYPTPLDAAKALRPFVNQPAVKPLPPAAPKPSTAETSRPAETAPEQRSPVAAPEPAVEPADWGTLTASAAPTKRAPKASPADSLASRGRPRWLWPAVACGLIALGLAGVLLSGVSVKTPDGTIVLEDLPADATVEIDGATVIVTRNGDQATFTTRPGKHNLKVTQAGKELLTNDVVITVGGKPVTVRVEPAKPDAKPAEAPKPKPTPPPTVPTKPSEPTPTPPVVVAAKPLPPIGQLLKNPGCEEPIAAGGIPGWETVAGQWQPRTADPAPSEGEAYFSPGDSPEAELRQDVDVSPWSTELDAGRLLIRVAAKHRGHPTPLAGDDTGAVKLEFLGAGRQPLAGGFDSGPLHSPNDWQRVFGEVRPPTGTRWVRVRLMASRTAPFGINNDAYFDDVSLTSVREVAAADGYVSMFNGKDLTGWQFGAVQQGIWQVENGVLVGRGDSGSATPWLETVSQNYGDFELRAEVCNVDERNRFIDFRTSRKDAQGMSGNGYRIALGGTKVGGGTHNKGSLWRLSDGTPADSQKPDVVGKPIDVPSRDWYVVQISARGPRIQCLINGQQVLDYTDPDPVQRTGRIALACRSASSVQYRKIEIKELASSVGKPLGVLPSVNPTAMPPGPDNRMRWDYSSGMGATAFKGAFHRVGEKAWCESVTRPKSQELYWFTETNRTADLVELERTVEKSSKITVWLKSDRCDIVTAVNSIKPLYTGSWNTKAGQQSTFDLKALSGWQFGIPKQVEVGADGLLLMANAGENSLLSTRTDFANMEIKASISAFKGTEAFLLFRASKQNGWKAIASRVYEQDNQIAAGMQSNLMFEERGMKRERMDFDQPFDINGSLQDRVLWLKVNTVKTSGVQYGGSRYIPTSGSGGITVKSGSIKIRSLLIADTDK